MSECATAAVRGCRPWAAAFAAGLLLCLAGCGGGGEVPKDFERFVPSEEKARQALDVALAAWRAGAPAGTVGVGPPAVYLADSHRKPGQRLQDFTVLGEAPGDGPRCFVVRVRLEDPREEQNVRFVVVGQDPIWVFRQEDYDMLSHWECKEDHARIAANAAKGKAPAPPGERP